MYFKLEWKKITKEKGTKKISCLELSLFQFLDICVLLSFTFVHWLLSMDYCTKNVTPRQKKYNILWSREIGGLVVCGYDGISVLFKKNYFVYLFPSSDSAMKTKITVCHYVLSVIWLWRFCLLNIRQTWVRDTHRNPAQHDFGHMPFLERHKRHLG